MIKIEVKGIKEVLELLDPKMIKRVVPRTLNKVGQQAQTALSRKVRETYNITASRLKEAITTQKATTNNPEVTIRARGRRPGLQHYGARQVRKGVSVLVTKAGGRKVIRHAFIPKTIVGVYRRKTKKRLPIERLTGPSVPQMIGKVGVNEFMKVVDEKIEKVFNHELEWELSKK